MGRLAGVAVTTATPEPRAPGPTMVREIPPNLNRLRATASGYARSQRELLDPIRTRPVACALGTAPQPATPSQAAARSPPTCVTAAIAASALRTLNTPGSDRRQLPAPLEHHREAPANDANGEVAHGPIGRSTSRRVRRTEYVSTGIVANPPASPGSRHQGTPTARAKVRRTVRAFTRSTPLPRSKEVQVIVPKDS